MPASPMQNSNSFQPNIVDLICGEDATNTENLDADFYGLVKRLRNDVFTLDSQIQTVLNNEAALPPAAIFPFLCRKFLELSLTSMLARVDPLRVVAARKHQRGDGYEPGKPNSSSISWLGDIFPKDKLQTGKIWDSAGLNKGPDRSLLGSHLGDAAIVPGLRWLCDNPSEESLWNRKIGNSEDPFAWLRGQFLQLYSTLSKGVHAEYLLDEDIAFDDLSIKQYAQDCYMLICLLAVATHVSPFFMRSISPIQARDSMLVVETRFKND